MQYRWGVGMSRVGICVLPLTSWDPEQLLESLCLGFLICMMGMILALATYNLTIRAK